MLDLGLSSYQLEAEEGFSFMKNTSLDMRAYKKDGITAGEILNSYDKPDLISLFENYGEIGNAERLVSAIINKRRSKKFETTFDLKETITEEYDLNKKNQIDFLAKIFQALRIEVNDELQNLENVLSHSIELIEKGGRIVIVSYHSLEDRIVKNFFKEESSDKIISDSPYGYENKIPLLKMLTKKPVVPTFEEIKFNSRSRSAKLRAAEIIENKKMKTKKRTNRKISIFYFLIMLIITSVIVVIYINNIIAVNQLAAGNNAIKEEIRKNVQSNDLLRTEAERLSSFERVKSIASEKYNLSYKENSVDEKNNIILNKVEIKIHCAV